MPSFSRTPARITEPAVGASVWASGSHVWTREQRHLHGEGHGEARNSQRAVLVARTWSLGDRDQVEGEDPPLLLRAGTRASRMPTSMNAEPIIV